MTVSLGLTGDLAPLARDQRRRKVRRKWEAKQGRPKERLQKSSTVKGLNHGPRNDPQTQPTQDSFPTEYTSICPASGCLLGAIPRSVFCA